MTADLTADDPIVFGKSGNHVFFVVGEHKLTSNVLEGTFPRYENVMPKSSETTLVIPTEELSSAVSLLANERAGRAVRLSLSRGKLELFSKTEVGEAQETLNLDYDGDEMSIGFNARYLLDFFNVVGSPQVRLELNPQRGEERGDEQKVAPGDKPGQLRPEPPGPMNYHYVVMPMHL
jgi:DNA polymerase-3 subunit beta